MFSPILALGSFETLLTALIWGVWVVLNLWIWQKSKATGNLLMLIGAGVLALVDLLLFLLIFFSGMGTLMLIGLVLLTAGFFLSVKPMVAAQIAALQAKAKHIGHKDGGTGGGTGTPPPAAH